MSGREIVVYLDTQDYSRLADALHRGNADQQPLLPSLNTRLSAVESVGRIETT